MVLRDFPTIVNTSQVVVIVDRRAQVPITSFRRDGVRTRLTFIAPSSTTLGAIQVSIRHLVVANRTALLVGLAYVQPCNYDTYCSQELDGLAFSRSLYAAVLPTSAECSPFYCVDLELLPVPEVLYALPSQSVISGGVTVAASVSNLFVTSVGDLRVRVGSRSAIVTSFREVDSTTFICTFKAPQGPDAVTVAATISSTSEPPTRVANFFFQFVRPPVGDIVVDAVYPDEVAAAAGDTVRPSPQPSSHPQIAVTLTNFDPVANSTDPSSIRLGYFYTLPNNSTANATVPVAQILTSTYDETKFEFFVPPTLSPARYLFFVARATNISKIATFNVTILPSPPPAVLSVFPSAALASAPPPLSVDVSNFLFRNVSYILNATLVISTNSNRTVPIRLNAISDTGVANFAVTLPARAAQGPVSIQILRRVAASPNTTALAVFVPFIFATSGFAASFTPPTVSVRGNETVRVALAALSFASLPPNITARFGSLRALNVSIVSFEPPETLSLELRAPPAPTAGVVTVAIDFGLANASDVSFQISYVRIEPTVEPTEGLISTSTSVR